MASAKNQQPAIGEEETGVILFPAMKPHYDPSKQSGVRTLLLVGRGGNGKSATGNTILGDKKFKSMSAPNGVTTTCELQRTVLENGLTLNVIDTPGLFDFSAELEYIGKDIVRCIDMAKDGIHAVLVVLSVRSRFSREEAAAIMSLQNFFGHRISDYMVVVFTGGDDLERNEVNLDDYLGLDCPEPLRDILEKCGNRKVLFDNMSKDKVKRAKQLNELLFLVDEVVNINGGKPFADEFFAELKKGEEKLPDHAIAVDSLQGNSTRDVYKEELVKNYEKLKIWITMLAEEKLKERKIRLEREARFEGISKCYIGSEEIR